MRYRINRVGVLLILGCAAMLTRASEFARSEGPPERLPEVTKKELATVVPHCFAERYTHCVWLRVDGEHWVERFRDGSESKYKILGRMRVRGLQGIAVAKIAGDPVKTGNSNDGTFQVFIPDKVETAEMYFRHTDGKDRNWNYLTRMWSVE